MDRESRLLAGIDAGGTTFKCAVADAHGELLERRRIPTSTPEQTISQVVDFFEAATKRRNAILRAVGVGAFGPLDVDPTSPRHGTILDCPKPGWSMTPLKQLLEARLNVKVSIDTDVNTALLAERHSGAAKGCNTAAYVTVGTGIGAGMLANGHVIGAPSHPEFGHIYVKRHAADQEFHGNCSFHGDCLEGLASARAFAARHGDPKALPSEHIGWRVEAHYLAQACIVLNAALRPERIILGGGLMQADHLIDLIREEFENLNANYLSEVAVADLIVHPRFGDDAGLVGAILKAQGAT